VNSKHHISNQLAENYPIEILVAEDNKLNQRIMKQILGKMGYSIGIADNGQIAAEAASEKNYDLILMDLEMPVMDGVSATELIRRQESEGRRTVIAALSANVVSERQDECYSAGMDEFLSKPIRIEELTEVIRKTAQQEYT